MMCTSMCTSCTLPREMKRTVRLDSVTLLARVRMEIYMVKFDSLNISSDTDLSFLSHILFKRYL